MPPKSPISRKVVVFGALATVAAVALSIVLLRERLLEQYYLRKLDSKNRDVVALAASELVVMRSTAAVPSYLEIFAYDDRVPEILGKDEQDSRSHQRFFPPEHRLHDDLLQRQAIEKWRESHDDFGLWTTSLIGELGANPDTDELLPPLLEALESDDLAKSIAATDALAALGTAARPALGVLLRKIDALSAKSDAPSPVLDADSASDDLPPPIDWATAQFHSIAATVFPDSEGNAEVVLSALPDEPRALDDVLERVIVQNSNDDLTRHIKSEREIVRVAAVMLLDTQSIVGANGPAVLDALLEASRDDTARVRVTAIRALGKKLSFQRPRILEALFSAFADPDESVRAEVLEKLAFPKWKGKVEESKLEPKLVSLLSDSSSAIRVRAVEELGRLGSTSHEALAALPELLRSDDSRIVLEALGRISLELWKAPELLDDRCSEIRPLVTVLVHILASDARREDTNESSIYTILRNFREHAQPAHDALRTALLSQRIGESAALDVGSFLTGVHALLLSAPGGKVDLERIADHFYAATQDVQFIDGLHSAVKNVARYRRLARVAKERGAANALTAIYTRISRLCPEIAIVPALADLAPWLAPVRADVASDAVAKWTTEQDVASRPLDESGEPFEVDRRMLEVLVDATLAAKTREAKNDERVVEWIVELLDSPLPYDHDRPTIRVDAARALGRLAPLAIDPSTIVASLDRALRHENWRVRRAAADSLGRFGGRAASAETTLTRTLDDTDPRVVHAVLAALSRVHPNALGKERLLTLLESDQLDTRRTAITAIGEIGPRLAKSSKVVAALLTHFEHEDLETRRRAIDALGMLGPEVNDGFDDVVEAVREALREAREKVELEPYALRAMWRLRR